MNASNIGVSLQAELVEAKNCLRAAEGLLELDLPKDAASRVYYAAFHASQAALLTKDIETRSHSGLRSQVSLHLVKTGELPASIARDLAELEGLRLAADYDRFFSPSVEVVREDLERARSVLNTIEEWLKASGWIPQGE